MTIRDWIKTIPTKKLNSLSDDAKNKLSSRGMTLDSLCQTESCWNDRLKCQESYVWNKDLDRIFLLWRGDLNDNWRFGREIK